MSTYPSPSTSIAFHWDNDIGNAECIAIMYAIDSGYNSREALIYALPQFSHNRLENALTTLLATHLVTLQIKQLILSPDAMLLDEITNSPALLLPVEGNEVKPHFLLDVLKRLGVSNPGVALGVIKTKSNVVESK